MAEKRQYSKDCKKCGGQGWYMVTDGIRRQEAQACGCEIPSDADLVRRLRVATKALFRERVTYWEDFETLIEVIRHLEEASNGNNWKPSTRLPSRSPRMILNMHADRVPCGACNGEGWIDGDQCRVCGARGWSNTDG